MPFVEVYGGESQIGLAGAAGRAQGKLAAQQDFNGTFLSTFQSGLNMGVQLAERRRAEKLEEQRSSEAYQRQKELEALRQQARADETARQQDFTREQNDLNRQNRLETEGVRQRSQTTRAVVGSIGRAVTGVADKASDALETFRKGAKDVQNARQEQQRIALEERRVKTAEDKAKLEQEDAKRKAEADAREQETRAKMSQAVLRRFGVESPDQLPLAGQVALRQIEKNGYPSDRMMGVLGEDAAGTMPLRHRETTDQDTLREYAAYAPKAVLGMAMETAQKSGAPSMQAVKAAEAIIGTTYDPDIPFQTLVDNRAELEKAPPAVLARYDQRLQELKVYRAQTVLPKMQQEVAEALTTEMAKSSPTAFFEAAWGEREAELLKTAAKKYGVSANEYREYLMLVRAQQTQALQQSQGGQNAGQRR